VPHCCSLRPGDGIGPEVVAATVRAVQATGVDICWRRAELNEAIILEAGKTLPQYLLDSLNETRVGLKGPVTKPIAEAFQSVNEALDLFANVRPVKNAARH
jgi:isocitrate dehydrogenase (NAD+)